MGLFCRKKKMFGEILVEKGLATKEDIDNALKIQKELLETKKVQKHIGAILQEKGVIEFSDIENVLEEQKRMDGFVLKSLIYSVFHSSR